MGQNFDCVPMHTAYEKNPQFNFSERFKNANFRAFQSVKKTIFALVPILTF